MKAGEAGLEGPEPRPSDPPTGSAASAPQAAALKFPSNSACSNIEFVFQQTDLLFSIL